MMGELASPPIHRRQLRCAPRGVTLAAPQSRALLAARLGGECFVPQLGSGS